VRGRRRERNVFLDEEGWRGKEENVDKRKRMEHQHKWGE